MALVIASIAILVLLTVWTLSGVRIVRPFERGVVERVGRFRTTAEPGLRMIVPLVDTVRTVDMREQVLDVAATDVMTKDNVALAVDAAVFYAPTDAEALVYRVANFTLALDRLAQTSLRSAVGQLTLEEALTDRAGIATALRTALHEATDAWGVSVRRVELQRVEPPADVLAAMHEQVAAERMRAALVTQAEGDRLAAIARAEGDRQARILRAEAERKARALAAEGDATAIRSLYEAIRESGPTRHEVTARSVEVLREMAATGTALTVVLPAGTTGSGAFLPVSWDPTDGLAGPAGAAEAPDLPPPRS